MPSESDLQSSQSVSKGQFRPKSYKKRKSISPRQPNQDSDGSDFDESKCLHENKPLLNYYNQKSCQVCASASDQSKLYFCDKCDDGYHNYCLGKNDNKPFTKCWICPKCVKEERDSKTLMDQNPIQIIEEISLNCHHCRKQLGQKKKQEIYFGTNLQKMMFEFEQQNKKCLYCQKLFHQDCFNKRPAALNCSKCQSKIRHRTPKGHLKFIEYYRKKFEVFKKEKYLTLQPLRKELWPSKYERKRYQKMGFKVPNPVTNWQLITQYEASIYYAFETRHLNFIEDQIYENPKTMDLNRWNRDYMAINELHEDDEKAFEMFKQNTRNGAIVGPYEIKEHADKGFHIIATDFIEKMTIITEYVGQVVSVRKSLFHHKKNDSIFMLIKNSRSSLSLDIVPHHFGNIARFFSGINNKNREGKKILNVEAMRFSYQGRIRIIFYAKKNIQAGDELFFDYNGSPFQEYPTESFKH